VHAVVVPAPNAHIHPTDLQAHVRAQLANYKVPRSIDIVEHLPLSGAGKILKRQLREDVLSRRLLTQTPTSTMEPLQCQPIRTSPQSTVSAAPPASITQDG
jgi:hypothetical protein